MSLKNSVIVISGGTRGIGRTIVEMCAKLDAKVIFLFQNNESLAHEITTQYSENTDSYQIDIKDYKSVFHVITKVLQKYGKIDILINNAGIRNDKSLALSNYEEWTSVINTNLIGTYNLTRSVIYQMIKRKKGRIINISSISGISGIVGQTNYSSSKAGLIGFTKSLAKEVATYGICVNAIAPGGIDTDMVNGLTEKQRKQLVDCVPLKRLGTPEEVAKVVRFLADDELSPDFLTGTVITLDGGIGT
uniref:3-oxoacyl-ACP reductase FabG n=1 Tax=Enterocloster clostridioformis TaxID=1531 RepID=UPI00267690D9|nr:3-oxoacyl-ACP reductase FabG [Enterocloster clostridioformis]